MKKRLRSIALLLAFAITGTSAAIPGAVSVTYASGEGEEAGSNNAGPVEKNNTQSEPNVTAGAAVSDEAGGAAQAKSSVLQLDGAVSDNISDNNYSVYGSVVNSYLTENSDGTFTRVECLPDSVVIETYRADGTRTDSKTLEKKMSLFGGFFSGSNANYIVYGQPNESESDSTEVLCFTMYDKQWNWVADVRASGINTYIPFEAGSLRMAETDGRLYIYTCHEMYKSEDGFNHQANMTFVFNESESGLLPEQAYFGILNIAQAGYVSHSFNQFIQTDGTYVYRVDHGDAHPRAVSLTRCSVNGRITSVKYTLPLQIGGQTGDNGTGVSVGGFELSKDACLITGNSVKQGSDFAGTSGQRNIFVTATSKDLSHTDTVWVTSYSGENVTVRTPQLVKINDNQFLLMWEEYDNGTENVVTKMAALDGNGKLTSDIASCSLPLSGCQPLYCADGMVRWYVTDDSAPVLYTIDPNDLGSLAGLQLIREEDEVPQIGKTEKVAAAPAKAKGTVKVTWSGVSNASGYNIRYSYSKKMKNPKIVSVKNASTVSKKIKGLKSGKYLYVQVQAYMDNEGTLTEGEWSDVVKSSRKIK